MRSRLQAHAVSLMLSFTLPACGVGNIQQVVGQQTGTGPVRYFPIGQGTCGRIGFDFGDGSAQANLDNVDMSTTGASQFIEHTYTGWGGKKTVKAFSVSSCTGSVQTTLTVAPSTLKVGFGQPTPAACSDFGAALGKPPLRKNTIVHITTVANTQINFGCSFNGCIHDADGENTPAPSSFAFPGLKKYSLVFMVGTQTVQGGTNVTFTTAQTGTLMGCVNDEPSSLSDNTGGWGVNVSIDESGAM